MYRSRSDDRALLMLLEPMQVFGIRNTVINDVTIL